jgi:hypothetical protein
LLKVAENSVNTMAQKGQLPAFKVRGQWRCTRAALDQGVEQRRALRDATGDSE